MTERLVESRDQLLANLLIDAPDEWSVPEVGAALTGLMDRALAAHLSYGADWSPVWPRTATAWWELIRANLTRDPAGTAAAVPEPGSVLDLLSDHVLTETFRQSLAANVPELPADLREIWAPHFVQSGREIGLNTAIQWAGFVRFCWQMMADVDYGAGQKPRPF